MGSSTNFPKFRIPVTGDDVGNPPPPPAPASKSYVTSPESYALSGKIMLSAIIILFVVVLLIVCLHVYARWFLTRSRHRRRQHNHRRRHRRTHLVFTMDISPTAALTRGLDSAVLKSLPTFNYSSTVHDPSLECAVCLSEFEDNEKGRLLPRCNHSFHTECIDMWFKSHSTCPLCRAPVNLLESPKSVQIVIDSAVSTSGITSDPETRTTTEEGGDEIGEMLSTQAAGAASSSSSNSVHPPPEMGRRKMEVSIEIPPRRNESFKNLEEESGLDSLSGRIRSFKRMLSRDRKPVSSPMSCGGSGIDFDLERGGGDIAQEEEQQIVITPRPVSQ